jgi:arginyl-tRNA synthetase
LKEHILELLIQALLHLKRDKLLSADVDLMPQIERTRSPEHGEFASNLALVLAKVANIPPHDLAQAIIDRIPGSRQLERMEIAGPGFINFFMHQLALAGTVKEALRSDHAFGHLSADPDHRVTLEFVSANPTGPLHVGHGRGAAYGASLASIMQAAGYTVQREYYVNDNGRQMDILSLSVWLRYLELCGEQVTFPQNGYRGEYIYDVARIVRSEYGDKWRHTNLEVYDGIPPDGPGEDALVRNKEDGDPEIHVDALIDRASELLGHGGYLAFFNTALKHILTDIREDLEEFGVEFDLWFSELELEKSGAIQHAIDRLEENGHLYVKDGATWLRASALGDEKDRVIVRENGRTTYFASDIAYLLSKLERGFDHAIYVLGADHHGYIARMKAAAKALGEDPDVIEILLLQFVVLFRQGEKVPMSTRSGNFISLRVLRDEVSSDAARYFFVMRSQDQHLDFNLDLAKSRTTDNPVYYIQYAHARIRSVFRNLEQMDVTHNSAIGEAALNLLTEKHELSLMRELSRYPEVIDSSARMRAPHTLAHYLHSLATEFHAYYNAHQFLVDSENLRNARLNLILAAQYVLSDGLELLGISAPEEM